jgi:hypothetical protein
MRIHGDRPDSRSDEMALRGGPIARRCMLGSAAGELG